MTIAKQIIVATVARNRENRQEQERKTASIFKRTI